MAENTQNTDKTPASEAQQDLKKASNTKAEASATATDELSEDDLDAVAGGTIPAYMIFTGR